MSQHAELLDAVTPHVDHAIIDSGSLGLYISNQAIRVSGRGTGTHEDRLLALVKRLELGGRALLRLAARLMGKRPLGQSWVSIGIDEESGTVWVRPASDVTTQELVDILMRDAGNDPDRLRAESVAPYNEPEPDNG